MPRLGMLALAGILLLPAQGQARGGVIRYGGPITCAVLPGYTNRPMVSRLTIDADGDTLRYTHPALDWQNIPMPADHLENGSGRLEPLGPEGRTVRLNGNAAGNGSWSYTVRYDGVLSGDVMRLRATQFWTGQGLHGSTQRSCEAELRRLGTGAQIRR